ncbi:MAG: RNA polymerase Rpb6 [Bacteroidetes bacterium CG23_combo_of_CG06-09_8_20_14_all_32_9]|nr:MAG: RNA polymerase Rpb6 [Bacteroidetes bacterium CG23_combo_of_CG06-09_8_20_14_all_32_9]
MDIKRVNASVTTITRDINKLEEQTGNIYKSVMVIAKRSNQISLEVKNELDQKLEEFVSYNDNLEEVFENREQIEVSRFYEKLPKTTSIALQEYIDGKLYFRNPEQSDKQTDKQ